jgi:hypothetical protein
MAMWNTCPLFWSDPRGSGLSTRAHCFRVLARRNRVACQLVETIIHTCYKSLMKPTKCRCFRNSLHMLKVTYQKKVVFPHTSYNLLIAESITTIKSHGSLLTCLYTTWLTQTEIKNNPARHDTTLLLDDSKQDITSKGSVKIFIPVCFLEGSLTMVKVPRWWIHFKESCKIHQKIQKWKPSISTNPLIGTNAASRKKNEACFGSAGSQGSGGFK